MSDPGGQLRAVLIGIEAYPTRPLTGCVNDIDAVQRLLLERAGVPAANIQRLASAHAPRPTRIPEAPATLANIRAALAALAAQVREGDDVLFYYSGHGVRLPVPTREYTIFREALVPIDVEDDPYERLLYDHELNGCLSQIAVIARSVTCVLDCCHSAGTTRSPAPAELRARALDPIEDLRWRMPPAPAAPEAARGSAAATPELLTSRCHIVSACLDFEIAMEGPGSDGLYHGLLTRAWLRALAGIPDAELRAARWSQIWQAMRADVAETNAEQHICMSGSPASRILGGPPAGGDAGLPLCQGPAGGYEIGAGSLECVTEDAVIAVYGIEPGRFPALGSPEDRAARLGLLRVTEARADHASAVAAGAPFELPPGARGRLVEAGRAARLRCAIEPHDDAIAAAVRESPLLEVASAARARVRLQQTPAGWLLVDEAHAASPSAALAVLRHHDPDRARAVLEHYYLYSLPLRLAEAARDLPDALDLRVLACEQQLAPARAQTAPLREARTRDRAEYELPAGARVCFRVHNRSRERLQVALLNVAASGRVQILGEGPLDGQSARTFWCEDQLGNPFIMTVPPERRAGVDRLVAIGTTDLSRDLRYLRVEGRFADLLGATRGAHDERRGWRKDLRLLPPGPRWTAARATVRTFQPTGAGPTHAVADAAR